jgi:hypothetical protein
MPPETRYRPNALYFFFADCDLLFNALEPGCELDGQLWCHECTKKMWANDAPRDPEFLANVRRYEVVSLRARLSIQWLAKATGSTPAALRKVMLSRPPA